MRYNSDQLIVSRILFEISTYWLMNTDLGQNINGSRNRLNTCSISV